MHATEIKARFPGAFGEPDQAPSVPLGHGEADACLHGGLRLGTLHEVFPASSGSEASAAGFALALARRALADRKWLLWVRQDFSALEYGDIHAAGLLELGLDPARVVLVRVADAVAGLRAVGEGLDCTGIGAAILETWGHANSLNLVASRRLALSAARCGGTAIALHFGMQPYPSAAETRWLIEGVPPSRDDDDDWGEPLFDAALVRNRHGACGRWIMTWNSTDALFQAHSRRLAAASSDRPPEAAMEGLRQTG